MQNSTKTAIKIGLISSVPTIFLPGLLPTPIIAGAIAAHQVIIEGSFSSKQESAKRGAIAGMIASGISLLIPTALFLAGTILFDIFTETPDGDIPLTPFLYLAVIAMIIVSILNSLIGGLAGAVIGYQSYEREEKSKVRNKVIATIVSLHFAIVLVCVSVVAISQYRRSNNFLIQHGSYVNNIYTPDTGNFYCTIEYFQPQDDFDKKTGIGYIGFPVVSSIYSTLYYYKIDPDIVNLLITDADRASFNMQRAESWIQDTKSKNINVIIVRQEIDGTEDVLVTAFLPGGEIIKGSVDEIYEQEGTFVAILFFVRDDYGYQMIVKYDVISYVKNSEYIPTGDLGFMTQAHNSQSNIVIGHLEKAYQQCTFNE